MLVEGDNPSPFVLQCVWQATGLRTISPVGTAACLGVADIALSRIGNAECAVDEMLQHDVFRHGGAYLGDFAQAQFTNQYELGESGVGEKTGLAWRTDIALGRGMQIDRRQVEFE